MATTQSQKRTIKHDVIKAWAEARSGEPGRVHSTSDALRIKLGGDDPLVEPLAWDKWFEIFDAESLAFVYEDPGYTAKIVKRNGQEDGATTAS